MNTDRESLLRLATRPLEGNPELLLAARGELEPRLDAAAAGDVAETIAAFQRADRRGFIGRHWRKLLGLAAFVLACWMGFEAFRMRQAAQFVRSISSLSLSPSEPKRPAHLTPPQLLLLYGSEASSNQEQRWKPLWDSDPANPAFFSQYAKGVFDDRNLLPPEMLEEAERIDPGNGWYPAINAGALLDRVVERNKQNDADRKALKAPGYTVKDEEKLAEALVLIHRAAAMPLMDSREDELFQMRLPLLGKRTDWITHIPILAYTAGISTPGALAVRRIPDALAVEAERCAARGDREGFERVVQSWESINRRFIEGGWTMIELLVARVMISSPATTFRDGAMKLGLQPEVERFTAIAEEERERRESQRRSGRGERNLIEQKASMLAGLTLPMIARQVREQPPLTDDDLRPSRLAEHALIQRAVAGAGGIILLLAAGIATLVFVLANLVHRKLSYRLCDLLDGRDWLRVIAITALAPVLLHGMLVYFTPLSAREWSMRGPGLFQIPLQMAAAVGFMLVLAAALAGSLLDQRLKVFGMVARRPRTRWIMAACAALALPVAGVAVPVGYGLKMPEADSLAMACFAAGALLAAVPLLWLLAGLVKPLFGFKDPSPRSATLARVLVPAWLSGFIALAATAPVHHAIERHWIQQDRLLEIAADAPAMSRYEWLVTQQLRVELLEMLDKGR